MAPLLAPYHSGMRLGSGFNTYTQQMCVNDAVAKASSDPSGGKGPIEAQSQSVVFKTSMVDKISDITDTLNISGALTIKYNNLIDGTGKGTFINSNKIKDADINFLLSVKVINETIVDHGLTDFTPIENLNSSLDFTEIYGDSFISGFQEGGEFVAVISIKVKDKNQRENIAANAAVALTTPTFGSDPRKPKTESKPKPPSKPKPNSKPKSPKLQEKADESPEDSEKQTEKEVGNGKAVDGKGDDSQEEGGDSNNNPEESDRSTSSEQGEEESEEGEERSGGKVVKGLEISGNARVKKQRIDIFQENEVTVSVTYSGGGQGLKKPDEDWNLENMRKAALRFPSLVAKNPVRTHAVLTKYTSLKSYYAKVKAEKKGDGTSIKHLPLCYDNAGIYTSILQDAFLDFKNIYKNIRLLEVDVLNGVKKLKRSSFNANLEGFRVPPGANFIGNPSQINWGKNTDQADPTSSEIDQPMKATLVSLERARYYVRRQMNLIVKEVDDITKDPTLASGERDMPCRCPLIFQLYLPIGVSIDEPDDLPDDEPVDDPAENPNVGPQEE